MITKEQALQLQPTQEIFELRDHPQFMWGVNRLRIISTGYHGIFVLGGVYPRWMDWNSLCTDAPLFVDYEEAMRVRQARNDLETARRKEHLQAKRP